MPDADDQSQILSMNVRSISPNNCWTDSEALDIQGKINMH